MSLTHAERLSSPVLERAVSRSVGNYALGMSCARAAANSYPPASKKPCVRAVVLLRPKLCARSVTPSALEKLRAIVGRALLVSVFAKQPRLFSAPPSRLAQKPPVPSGALRASVMDLQSLRER